MGTMRSVWWGREYFLLINFNIYIFISRDESSWLEAYKSTTKEDLSLVPFRYKKALSGRKLFSSRGTGWNPLPPGDVITQHTVLYLRVRAECPKERSLTRKLMEPSTSRLLGSVVSEKMRGRITRRLSFSASRKVVSKSMVLNQNFNHRKTTSHKFAVLVSLGEIYQVHSLSVFRNEDVRERVQRKAYEPNPIHYQEISEKPEIYWWVFQVKNQLKRGRIYNDIFFPGRLRLDSYMNVVSSTKEVVDTSLYELPEVMPSVKSRT